MTRSRHSRPTTEHSDTTFHGAVDFLYYLDEGTLKELLNSIGQDFLRIAEERGLHPHAAFLPDIPQQPSEGAVFARSFAQSAHPDLDLMVLNLRWLIPGADATGEFGTEQAEFLIDLGRDMRKFGLSSAKHYEALVEATLHTIEDFFSFWDDLPHGPETTLAEILTDTIQSAAALLTAGSTGEADGATGQLPATVSAQVLDVLRPAEHIAVVRMLVEPPLPYWPGQFVEVRTPYTPRLWRKLTPAIPFNPHGMVEFHVHGVGAFSQAIVHAAKPGDRWTLANPYGELTISGERDVVAICGSTGLAPVRAMLLDLGDRIASGEFDNAPRIPHLHLFYGAQTPAGLYDERHLRSLEQAYPWLTLTTCVERKEAASEGTATVDAVGLVGDIALYNAEWQGAEIIICGSAAMKAYTSQLLLSHGAPRELIQFDLPDPTDGAEVPI